MVVLAGSLPPGVFPIILFSLGEPNDNEIAVGKRQIPTKFQYRIVPMTFPFDAQHRPWKSERETLMSQTSRCADLLANRDIRIRRDGKTTTENVRLDPLPLEQTWEGITFKSEREGIQRHFLSSCCNQAECKDRCLTFPEGERWMLEILTPQWGVDEVRVVSSLVNQGGSSREFYVVQEDPGVWPVLRVPCLYCPLKSCISNCSNGEYSTGLTDVVNGLQVNRIECKPCPPGTWNTCTSLPNCKWAIPSAKDLALGRDIHLLPGGPVGNCYPCSAIRTCQACRVHYEGTPRKTFIETTLAWRCPGGDEPPVNCPTMEFRMSPDGSACICQAGLYQSGTSCIPCEPGHMCPNGTMVPCPMHYYQPAAGATSCMLCASSADDNGFFKCYRKGYLLPFCDPARKASQTSNLMSMCVPCNQCRRAYASYSDPNMLDCYRDD